MDVAFGAIMLFLAVALLFETTRPQYAGIESLNYGFPPSFYPRILLSFWTVLSVIVIVRGLRDRRSPAQGTQVSLRLVGAIAVTAGYVWLLGQAGFLISTILFVLTFLVVVGYRQWLIIAAVTAVFPVSAWWLLNGPLRLVLPTSPWFAGF